ncbi:MAG: putative hydrolase [Alphaproteobacteria bacterium ADurb.Bin438]|nr:MAG: putative hydrolase [Alphaproteobacteria bacterium ADurb.Bin438]
MKITILGCGSSAGVPSIARGFGDCDPNNKKNIRTRSSVLIEEDGRRLLIDTSADLRTQFLRENIKYINGVLFTHDHFDHTGGLVDLRDINRLMNSVLNIYGSKETLESLEQRFPFVFAPPRMLGDLYLTPYTKPNILEPSTCTEIAGFKVSTCNQHHGFIKSFGYRVDDFGYITDFSDIIDDYHEIFKGIKKLVIGCQTIDNKPCPIHANLNEVLRIVKELEVERAYLTHMCPSVDYEHVKTLIPANVEPAYDGMVFEI